MGGDAADLLAFLVGPARLLKDVVEVARGARHPHRIVRPPTLVRIRHGLFAGFNEGEARLDPPDILGPVGTHLDLELPVARRPVAGHLGGGFFGGALGRHAVHRRAVGQLAAQ